MKVKHINNFQSFKKNFQSLKFGGKVSTVKYSFLRESAEQNLI